MKRSNRDVRARVVDGGITHLRIGNRAFYKLADIEGYRDGRRQNPAADHPVNPDPNRRRMAGEARP
jgi:hypothetical protein